ncbi:molybdenum ABC transporter ATP-binding protein [Agarivorans aestuarii]|uniref:Molybdenum ABC transporter ATP-binding protein n=1 Tax=Agarivorans aestuarii TaxID=1563703 RepID=A0ABU7G1J8_9ALTE|nr:molybdenum ABC transporter ATP-binding protein [Agarivorans aestuarii]MEE1673274.1 molybdenum ABC transporter ATP-binding protein [Agarivorans aestuarii]
MCLKLKIKALRGDFYLDVDLELASTGVSALFGASGSGKSSCLRAIAGLDSLPNTLISFNQEVWQDTQEGLWLAPHKREIGYVFQDASLFPHLSVKQNLLFSGQLNKQEQSEALTEVCLLLDIQHLINRMPGSLSGGERQRVAIARALLSKPKLLLMDEPLSALDTKLKQEIIPYLEQLHQHLSIPIVYVSHDIDEVKRLADTMIVLEKGQVVSQTSLSQNQNIELITAKPYLKAV